MAYYLKLPDGTRVGPFSTIVEAHDWAELRKISGHSFHLLQSPDIPCNRRHEQGPDH